MTANLWPGTRGRRSPLEPRGSDFDLGEDHDRGRSGHVALVDDPLVDRQRIADDPGEGGHDDGGKARVTDCRIGVHGWLLVSFVYLSFEVHSNRHSVPGRTRFLMPG